MRAWTKTLGLVLLGLLAVFTAVTCHQALAASTPGVRAWRKANPCPHVCDLYRRIEDGQGKLLYYSLYFKCGACDVDHDCSQKCGGKDGPPNLHWMDAKKNRSKGAGDCSRCTPEKRAPRKP